MISAERARDAMEVAVVSGNRLLMACVERRRHLRAMRDDEMRTSREMRVLKTIKAKDDGLRVLIARVATDVVLNVAALKSDECFHALHARMCAAALENEAKLSRCDDVRRAEIDLQVEMTSEVVRAAAQYAFDTVLRRSLEIDGIIEVPQIDTELTRAELQRRERLHCVRDPCDGWLFVDGDGDGDSKRKALPPPPKPDGVLFVDAKTLRKNRSSRTR